ncbi:MAG: proton-conducting transporter membrane subunit [Euryarchaeota archaeon]|nr:proton-conducting transporter membrane subunit [Euryarchaeota archaeon]
MMGLTLNVMDMGMLSALVILTLGSIGSFKNSKLGFYGAIIALVIGFSAIAVSAAHFLSYGIFILAIAIINLVSLEAIKSEIKGVDYGLVGLMALATLYIFNTSDFALVLAALVLVSVPTYILVMVREGGANVEVGIKYITFMVLATVLFLIGAIMLVYTKNAFDGSLYVLGYVMLVLGLCLEVGVAPLHEWVPDVFSSADPIPISIIASLAKIVPFIAALWILVYTSCDLTASITLFTAVIAAVSMFVGNIGALTSKELARVLGYSTVAGMGYVLTCLVVVARPEYMYLALTGGLLMLFANAAGKIGFFNAIKGGGAYSPLMYILAFSFIGVPPLMGFWGKLFILLSLAKMEYFWLVGIVVINSAISIPYYVRLATELGVDWKPNLTNFICLAAVVMVLVTVFLLPVEWFYSTMEVIAQTVGIAI